MRIKLNFIIGLILIFSTLTVESEEIISGDAFISSLEESDQIGFFDKPAADIFLSQCNSLQKPALDNEIKMFCDVVVHSDVCQEVKEEDLMNCSDIKASRDFDVIKFFKGCTTGLFDSVKELIAFVWDVMKWVGNAVYNYKDTYREGAENLDSVKLYLVTEYDKAYEDASGISPVRSLKAANAVASTIAGMLFKGVQDYLHQEYEQFGCMNFEARTRSVCKVAGDIIIPPAAAFALIKYGTKSIKMSGNLKRSLSKGNNKDKSDGPDKDRENSDQATRDGPSAESKDVKRLSDERKDALPGPDSSKGRELAHTLSKGKGASKTVEEKLALFRDEPFSVREEYASMILKGLKLSPGGVIDEAAFMALVMQTGRYGSSFSKGPKDFARELLASIKKGPKASHETIDKFFKNKGSKTSARRSKKFKEMIDEIHKGSDIPLYSPKLLPPPTSHSKEIALATGRSLARKNDSKNTNDKDFIDGDAKRVDDADFSLTARGNVAATAGSAKVAKATAGKPKSSFGKKIAVSAGVVTTGVRLSRSSESSSTSGLTSDGNAESDKIPTLQIRVVGGDINDLIEPGSDQFDFEVEAYFEDSDMPVPPGKFEWECVPPGSDPEICDVTDYEPEGESQSVKLFERVPYVLEATYVVEPDVLASLGEPPRRLELTLEMKCETNESGTQCVSDDESRETASTEDGEGAEGLRQPFWWESLPPNAPPPQFQPGPPFQMRTFILPGSI